MRFRIAPVLAVSAFALASQSALANGHGHGYGRDEGGYGRYEDAYGGYRAQRSSAAWSAPSSATTSCQTAIAASAPWPAH